MFLLVPGNTFNITSEHKKIWRSVSRPYCSLIHWLDILFPPGRQQVQLFILQHPNISEAIFVKQLLLTLSGQKQTLGQQHVTDQTLQESVTSDFITLVG